MTAIARIISQDPKSSGILANHELDWSPDHGDPASVGVTSVGRGTASNEYELLAPLAEGGMAEIFLARARGLAGMERYVVLKRILRDHAADPRWVEMFLDEARLVARLHHPNIAQVFDLGKIDDTYFFTMEYIHGEDLRAIWDRSLRRGERVPLGVAIGALAGAAAGLAYAHELCDSGGTPLHIVHRDVSPSNILVSYDGGVKVVDFGVARANLRSSKTASGAVKGKISYFSPEQCQNRTIDARTDVFSLGIVLWELCTGRRLYRRDSDFDEMNAIINEPPEPPSSIDAELPAELDEVVLKALAKQPDDRFATARELQEALEAVADRASIACSPSVLRRYLLDVFGPREEPWRTITKRAHRKLTIADEAPRLGSGSDVAPVRTFAEASNPSASGAMLPETIKLRSSRLWIVLFLLGAATIAVVVFAITRGSGDDTRDQRVVDPAPSAAPRPTVPAEPPAHVETPAPPPEPPPPPVEAKTPPDAAIKTPIKRPRVIKKKQDTTCTDPLECQF